MSIDRYKGVRELPIRSLPFRLFDVIWFSRAFRLLRRKIKYLDIVEAKLYDRAIRRCAWRTIRDHERYRSRIN